MPVALYSAAEFGRLRWATAVALVLLVVSTAFRVREGDSLALLFGYELASQAALMAAVVALGDAVRSRRRWRAALRHQAAAAEAEREREAARAEQERLRIARELHDVLAHTLSVVSLHGNLAEELTDREREVLTEVGAGRSNAEIGSRLFISPATARTHVSRLLAKLGARDRAQLVVLAYETGLVVPGTDR